MPDMEMNNPSAMADAAARKPVIRLDDARLSLSSADGMVEILRGISLSIDAGQTVGVLSSARDVMGRLKLLLTQVSCFGDGARSRGRQACP